MALELQIHQNLTEAGCDEAGRGCLAGPVVAAAVILPAGFFHPKLNDSKQVPEKMRFELRDFIQNNAVAWGIGICSPEEIDEINILNASIKAMHKALRALNAKPEFIAVDGNRFKPFDTVPHQTVVKGDGRYLNIAAASILAKTHRDELMTGLAADFPEYGWDRNMGYPTVKHRDAIRKFGATVWHRKSFRLLDQQIAMF